MEETKEVEAKKEERKAYFDFHIEVGEHSMEAIVSVRENEKNHLTAKLTLVSDTMNMKAFITSMLMTLNKMSVLADKILKNISIEVVRDEFEQQTEEKEEEESIEEECGECDYGESVWTA